MSKLIRIHKNTPRIDYPIAKVILSYAFWGGGLGGALLATWLMFGMETHEPTNFLPTWFLLIFFVWALWQCDCPFACGFVGRVDCVLPFETECVGFVGGCCNWCWVRFMAMFYFKENTAILC